MQDLFTRDVTAQGLRELVERETQDTYRFFAREIDRAALQHEPWYRRGPLLAWQVFLAIAYRLSPARRLLFAFSVPVLLLGWLGYVWYWLTRSPGLVPRLPDLLLLGATGLLLLLALELRDKLALKGDLEVAREIQFGLLPFEPYLRPGLAVHATMRPANTVGGDYFDVIELPDGRVALAVGDVAGKGMPAALLMALLQGSLRTLLSAGIRRAELVLALNAHLGANIPSNRLVTLFYGEYDPDRGVLTYVNAGHNAPLVLRRTGRPETLPATGMALGVLPGAEYPAAEARLEPGDRVFLYTDGLTEAEDPAEAEYGEERLLAYLIENRGLGHADLLSGVRDDVLAFCRGVRLRDDMTLMILAREAEAAAAPPASRTGRVPASRDAER